MNNRYHWLQSLCKNGPFEALEGRPNVIAPREASRNGGLGCATQPEPLGGDTRYSSTGRSVTSYFAPGELIGVLCICPPVPLRCTGGYDIDSPLRGCFRTSSSAGRSAGLQLVPHAISKAYVTIYHIGI